MKLRQLPATPAVRTVTRRSFGWLVFTGAVLLRRALSPAAVTGEMLAAGTIPCPGQYIGHLQGVCANDAGGIFWSFTTTLVRTTERGILQAKVRVPAHHDRRA